MEEQRYAIMREVVEENFSLIGRFSIGDLFPSLTWLEGFIGLSKRASRNKSKWDLLLDEVIQLSLKNDPDNNFDLTMDQVKGLLVVSYFPSHIFFFVLW
jgi:hypothetical protein